MASNISNHFGPMMSLRGLWPRIMAEIGSRKFRALLGIIMVIWGGAFQGSVGVTLAIQETVLALFGYMGWVAIEDGLKG